MPRSNQNHLYYLSQLKKSTSIYDRHGFIQTFSIICCWVAIFNLLYTTQPILASVLSAVAFLAHGFIQRIDILFSQQLEESLTLVDTHDAAVAKRTQTAALVAQDIKSMGNKVPEDDILHSELDYNLISTPHVENAYQKCLDDGDSTLNLSSCIAIIDYPLTYESYEKSDVIARGKVYGSTRESKKAWIDRFISGSENGKWKASDRYQIGQLLKNAPQKQSLPITNPYPPSKMSYMSALWQATSNDFAPKL